MNASDLWQAFDWIEAGYSLQLTHALVHFLWQGCAIATVYAVVARLLRQAAANTRYVAGVVALLLMVACLPVTLLVLPSPQTAAVDAAKHPGATSTSGTISPRAGETVGNPVAWDPASTALPANPAISSQTPWSPKVVSGDVSVRPFAASRVTTILTWVSPYISGLYSCGVVVMLLRVALGLWGGRRLRNACTRVADGPICEMIRDHTRRLGTRVIPLVAYSQRISMPVVVGVLRPMILMPASLASGLTLRQLEAVFLHELAHIHRFDLALNVLQRLVEAMLFFHPAVWWVSRRISAERENACDDLVLRSNWDRTEYAEALVRMAELCTATGDRAVFDGAALAATGENSSQFKRRVLRLLSHNDKAAIRLTTTGVVISILLILSVLLAPVAWRSAARAEKESKATSVAGRVVMASDGKPVANAQVRLLRRNLHGYLGVKTCRTNEQGEFAFEELAEGRYRILAFRQNFGSRSRRLKKGDVRPGDSSILLELREAPSLEVKVVSSKDGESIPGALVQLGAPWNRDQEDYLCDANGEVVIHGLTPRAWEIWARAKGFALRGYAVSLTGTDTTRMTVELSTGAELRGTVRDESGKGVAGVIVNVYATSPVGIPIDYVKTDAEGNYRFEDLPLTEIRLSVSGNGYVSSSSKARPSERQDVNITLRQRPYGGVVRGVVVDSKGSPISGATIKNHGGSSSDVRSAETGEDGTFQIEDVFRTWRAYELVVKAKGFAPQLVSFSPGTKEEPAEVRVTLHPGHFLRGRVVDENLSPIAEVSVTPADDSSTRGFPRDFVRTDDQGRFEFDSLSADTPFDFDKRGYSKIHDRKLPLDRLEQIVVSMLPTGVIVGRVVDDKTEKPLSPFTVALDDSPDRTPDDPLSGFARSILMGEQFDRSDGMFRFENLTQGQPFQVTVKADGYDRKVARRVEVVADGETEPVEFRLIPTDTSKLLRIAGQVVGQQSQPMPGVQLRLLVTSKQASLDVRRPINWYTIRSGEVEFSGGVLQFMSVTADDEGRFRFEGVRGDADIELAYWGSDVSAVRLEHLERLSPEEFGDLTVRSRAPGVVRGTINGNVFPEIRKITLSGPARSHEATLSQQNDSYEIRDVPAGQHQLRVYGPHRPSDRGPRALDDVIRIIPVEVKSGETTTLDLGAESDDASQPAKPESSQPVSMSAEEFSRLPAADQRALLVRVFQRRLEHSRNLYYEMDQLMRGHENRDGEPGKPLGEDSATRRQYRHWRLGDSFRVDVNSYRNLEDAGFSTCSSMGVNAEEGVGRHATIRMDGKRPPSGQVNYPFDPSDSNRYLYWLTRKRYRTSSGQGERLFPYLLDRKDEFEIKAPVAGDKVQLTVDWQPDWAEKPGGKREYLLDPRKGFLPVRCDSRYDDPPTKARPMWRVEKFVVEESRLVGDMWMPVKLTEKIAASPVPDRMNVYQTKVSRIECGTVTPADIRVPFTEGMKIADTNEGVTYVADARGRPGADLKLAPQWKHEPPEGWLNRESAGARTNGASAFSMASRLSPADREKLDAEREKERKEREERWKPIETALKVLQADPPATDDERIVAGLDILQIYRIGENEAAWASAIRELIQIGEPAVPKLTEELDRTEKEETLRALGFVLRGIGDPRAVPALIRAIPRMLQPSRSDYGLRLDDDLELAKFMAQHDNKPGAGGRSGYFSYGRPIREIMPALDKMTGETHGWMELNFVHLRDGVEQQRIQRKLFLKLAERWADWWSKNWQRYVKNEADAQLDRTKESLDQYSKSISMASNQPPRPGFPRGPNVTEGGGARNWLIRSFDDSPSSGFLDLDSGRRPCPAQELIGKSAGHEPSKELLAWAEQEGVDLINVKIELPGSDKSFFAFKPLGMKVWRIENSRFESIQNELRESKELGLSAPWEGLLAQIDEQSGAYDDKLTASFLFITREGTCGAIQIRSPLEHAAYTEGGLHYKFFYEGNREK